MEIAFIPRFLLKWFAAKNINQIHLNIFLSNFLVVLTVAFLGSQPLLIDKIPHKCISQALLHINCPGCGISTGLMSLFNFRISDALAANPVSILLGAFMLFQIIARPIAILKEQLSKKIIKASLISNYILLSVLFIHFFLHKCNFIKKGGNCCCAIDFKMINRV